MGGSEFTNLKNYIFGSSAAIVTNTSLIVGLGSAQTGKAPLIGALLTIALADNISDSLGIHLYKETEGGGSQLSLLATVLNFTARLLVSLSFVAIVLVSSVGQSIVIGVAWGLVLITLINYLIARNNSRASIWEISQHVLVAIAVVVLSRYVGYLVAKYL